MNNATEQVEYASPRRFRRYREYRESGVEWLGEIPSHWEVKRLSWLTKCLDGKRIPLNAEERGRMQGNYPYWGANSIVDYVDQWLFDEELVLLGEDGAPFFDRSRPVAIHVKGKIWVNNHAHVLRPQSTVDAGFLAHALNCIDYRAFIDGSTRDKLTQSAMSGIPIQYPVVQEQRAIAAFLDRETAKIDGLVERKERLIELLQEKRLALITRAVTQGLAPNVPMKDSGIEWLGEIPAHWEVKRLKHQTPGATVGIVVTPSKYYVDEGIPCLRSLNVSRGSIDMRNLVYISESANELHRKSKIFAGDVVVVRTGQAGTAAVVPKELDGANCIDLLIVRRSEELLPQFVYYYLNSHSATSQAEELSVGAIQAHYNTSTLAQLIVPKIPKNEQNRIVIYLDQATGEIDALIAKVRQAIDHLKEFRTALISAAVTGKIDVREETS